MLRTEQRRRTRRAVLRTRILAAGTAILLAVGVAVGGGSAAMANPTATLSTPVVSVGGVTTYDQNGLVCDAVIVGFEKPAALDGGNLDSDGVYTAAWGSISWDVSSRTVTWDIVPGWDVDICVKGGTYLSTIDTSVSSSSSYTHSYAGLSHLGFRVNASQPTNDLDCVTATNYPGRALTNGDHITMDITQGLQTFQVSASVDIRQAQDPESESGLVLRVNAPGGPYTLPITNDQKNSGTLSFSYATYLSGSFTVEWVQFNATYFNQDRDEAEFLDCTEPPTLPITDASIAFIAPTCDLGQQLDPTAFVVDAELARYAPELSSLTGSSYTVVFVITDEDAVFFDSDTPPAGRVVSDEGKTLTFTGTLLGPDRSENCVTTVVLRDPVSYVDSCLEGASFTITRVEGILYTVVINDDEPFEVVWNDGETTRTYPVDEGDAVRVVPSPASDRYTISPDPAPFERTFAVYEDDCLPTLPLTEGSAAFTPASCVDPTNRVTLASVEGVQWWIDGTAVAAGTRAVDAGDVVVTATPLPGYGFPLEAQTRWEFTAVAVDPECLPTLAFTGATSALAGLGGFSLLLLLVGFGAMAVRRQQA